MKKNLKFLAVAVLFVGAVSAADQAPAPAAPEAAKSVFARVGNFTCDVLGKAKDVACEAPSFVVNAAKYPFQSWKNGFKATAGVVAVVAAYKLYKAYAKRGCCGKNN